MKSPFRWLLPGLLFGLLFSAVFITAMLLLVKWLDADLLQKSNNLGGTFNILTCFVSALAMAAAFYAAFMQHRQFKNAEKEQAVEARLAAATAILSSYPAVLESRLREVGELLTRLGLDLTAASVNAYSLDSIREFKSALAKVRPQADASATRQGAENALLHSLMDKLGDMEDLVSAIDLAKGAILTSVVRTLKHGEGV